VKLFWHGYSNVSILHAQKNSELWYYTAYLFSWNYLKATMNILVNM